MPSNTFDIDELLKIYGASPDYRPQFEHRVNIVKSWNILPGSRVLEIGPGQGDCTIVLATAVGESGHVDAVDPAPLDYGTPIFPLPRAEEFPLLLQHYLTSLLRLPNHNRPIPSAAVRLPSRSPYQLDRRLPRTPPLHHHVIPNSLHTYYPLSLPLVLLFAFNLSIPPTPPPHPHSPGREPLYCRIRSPRPFSSLCAARAGGSDFGQASS